MQADPFSQTHSNVLAPADQVRRLRWRARRGLLENDIIIDRFFSRWSEGLDAADHHGLALLLDLTDNDLMDLLLARQEPEGHLDTPEVRGVLYKLREV